MILLRKILWYSTLATVALFLLLVAIGFQVDEDTTLTPGVAGRHVLVDGLKMRVLESGTGPKSVVLLHGMLGSADDWETVIPLLEGRYRVIAIDRPGQGFSEAPREDNTLAVNARLVRGLMTVLDLKDVVVVGHSYGGSVALQLASEAPPALRGLVLVTPGAYPGFPTGVVERLITAPLVGRGLTRALIPLIGEERIRHDLTEIVAPDAAIMPKDFFSKRMVLWKKPGPLRAYAEHSLAYGDDLERLSQSYPQLKEPVVILQGDADSFQSLRETSARLAKEIPGATLRTFPATGHYLQYRHPQAVAEAVDQLHGITIKNPRNHRSAVSPH